MEPLHFPTDYFSILDRIKSIDPISYSQSRNYTNGAVSLLSPYISRGVISPGQIIQSLFERGYDWQTAEKFIQQMAWREYFQRTWETMEDGIFEDIRRRNTGTRHRLLPSALVKAKTGIDIIDQAIQQLQDTGYLHNHLRMYVASLSCNIGKAYWPMPSQWMYYHLLDGDLASNTCSWQWVAGSFSSKQYFCNQENINRYTNTLQQGTYLDKSYEELPLMPVPTEWLGTETFQPTTPLPSQGNIKIDPSLPLHLYNSYQLDPLWRQEQPANRILLLEPSHFRQFPVSGRVIQFITDLANNIPGIQVFAGELRDLPNLQKVPAIYSKKHPAFLHYPGLHDEPDWLFPGVKGQFPSFFSYWKACTRSMKKTAAAKPCHVKA